MDNFTPIASLVGGILIGLSSLMVMAFSGRIAGISGIFSGLLSPGDDTFWRSAFIAGLVSAGVVAVFVAPSSVAFTIDRSAGAVIVAGLLVGFGTRLGSGCTSGHGICGISRFSPRSLVAVLTFMATGAVSVFVVHHILGGSV